MKQVTDQQAARTIAKMVLNFIFRCGMQKNCNRNEDKRHVLHINGNKFWYTVRGSTATKELCVYVSMFEAASKGNTKLELSMYLGLTLKNHNWTVWRCEATKIGESLKEKASLWQRIMPKGYTIPNVLRVPKGMENWQERKI